MAPPAVERHVPRRSGVHPRREPGCRPQWGSDIGAWFCFLYYGNRGRPRLGGNRSSMKKCTRPRMPTFFPLRELIGTVASTPNWRYFPNQMSPGLTVPVVWPPQPRLRQVFSANSTTGIMRLKGAPSPTSLTKACRYCRLYCRVTPQLRVIG